MRIYDIIWTLDTDDDFDPSKNAPCHADLPDEVNLPDHTAEEDVANRLSDEYGFLVESYKIDREAAKEEFLSDCYEMYRLDWMFTHGVSIVDYIETVAEMASIRIDDDTFAIPSNGKEAKKLVLDAADSAEGFGFCGTLWACQDEFLESEFLDREYMHSLFSRLNSYDREYYGPKYDDYMDSSKDEDEIWANA